ncbi:MAG: hypothetical protein HPY61_00820 [Methanotrichaceae archaeon]|nr:hypothetical protein [Methanotrichaceae archaeon]
MNARTALKACLALCCIAAACGLALGNVVINEIELSAPNNASIWAEIYNSGTEPVDLTGWMVKIVDGPWAGPIELSGQIGPSGFVVAEGDPRWTPGINATVYLYDSAGNLIDRTYELSDSAQNDFTWSRIPDGKDTDTRADFAYFMGSKGRSNGSGSIRL